MFGFNFRSIWNRAAKPDFPYTKEQLDAFYDLYVAWHEEGKKALLEVYIVPEVRQSVMKDRPDSKRQYIKRLKNMDPENRREHLREMNLGYRGCIVLHQEMADHLKRAVLEGIENPPEFL